MRCLSPKCPGLLHRYKVCTLDYYCPDPCKHKAWSDRLFLQNIISLISFPFCLFISVGKVLIIFQVAILSLLFSIQKPIIILLFPWLVVDVYYKCERKKRKKKTFACFCICFYSSYPITEAAFSTTRCTFVLIFSTGFPIKLFAFL